MKHLNVAVYTDTHTHTQYVPLL